MKPCRITGRVVCRRNTKCPSGLTRIKPECALCFDASIEILDLDGNVIYELKNLPAVKKPAAKEAKPKTSKAEK